MKKKIMMKNKGGKTPYNLIRGKEVTFQLLRGTIIEGIFSGDYGGFFIVTDAEIKGEKNVCRTDLVFIHKNQVQHFHLKGEVKPKE